MQTAKLGKGKFHHRSESVSNFFTIPFLFLSLVTFRNIRKKSHRLSHRNNYRWRHLWRTKQRASSRGGRRGSRLLAAPGNFITIIKMERGGRSCRGGIPRVASTSFPPPPLPPSSNFSSMQPRGTLSATPDVMNKFNVLSKKCNATGLSRGPPPRLRAEFSKRRETTL